MPLVLCLPSSRQSGGTQAQDRRITQLWLLDVGSRRVRMYRSRSSSKIRNWNHAAGTARLISDLSVVWRQGCVLADTLWFTYTMPESYQTPAKPAVSGLGFALMPCILARMSHAGSVCRCLVKPCSPHGESGGGGVERGVKRRDAGIRATGITPYPTRSQHPPHNIPPHTLPSLSTCVPQHT